MQNYVLFCANPNAGADPGQKRVREVGSGGENRYLWEAVLRVSGPFRAAGALNCRDMDLRIAVCQTDAAWLDADRSLASLEPRIAAADADLVLLPELFATGFALGEGNVRAAAEPPDGPVATTLRRWASRYGCALAGSLAVTESGRTFNRMLFVEPSGASHRYDKRHLFVPGGEGVSYTPGDRRVVVTYRGVRFLLLVCYDLRFPVWIRNRGDYDAILCSASWPSSRRAVWQTLLRARAIENQCFVAGANRTGSDPSLRYSGDSALIDCRGTTLAEGGSSPATLRATFDAESQRLFRDRFPAWRDADPFRLGV